MSEGIKQLEGMIITNIDVDEDIDVIMFYADLDHRQFQMHHSQDCCEHVYIAEVHGDLNDLLFTPILVAEERSEEPEKREAGDDSETWTFYELRTIKGSVTIRWIGSSNGYYSESVNFEEVPHGHVARKK